ncbi:mRNA splicing protein SMB1 Ecym_1209 [Eremothecium cymbalariae DBVPG|uniref:Sm protein B n=1 Tax=Eremothecium cymbalariae (strain CBS 270.75 / DBVPG 7215 / KCTC 17166 / NRRL Y-17582) TaxID=931890 RepID=G8JMZ2_ERECY|nr:hypothetical protein Ecym_1209 [Eremothecium cymbalariae DBVPG\
MNKPTVSDKSTLKDLINYRLRVLAQDGRVYIGLLLAFDAHMNLVLADCIEERLPEQQLKTLQHDPKHLPKPQKRTLGLAILRGEHVLSTLVESPPTLTKRERAHAQTKHKKKQVSKKQRATKASVGRVASSSLAADAAAAAAAAARPRPGRFQAPPGFRRR